MKGSFVNTIKYLLYTANILVFVMSCIVCGFGSFTLIDTKSLTHLILYVDKHSSVNQFATASVLLIIISMILMFVTFLGCCGAIQGNRCMLATYFSFIFAMFIFMIVAAVLGSAQNLTDLKDPLLKSMTRYDQNSHEPGAKRLTSAWDNFQADFECCGVTGYGDWTTNPMFRTGNSIPESCCKAKNLNISSQACAANPAGSARLLQGCFGRADERLRADSADILAVAVTLIVVMFVDMILSFAMCLTIK